MPRTDHAASASERPAGVCRALVPGAWPAFANAVRVELGRAASRESLAVEGRGSSLPKIIVTGQMVRAAG
jgi:hypothetical protein